MSIYHFIRQLAGNEQFAAAIKMFEPRAALVNNSQVGDNVSGDASSGSVQGLLDGLIACGLLSLLTENMSLANKVGVFKGPMLHTDVVSTICKNYNNAVKRIRKQAANDSRDRVHNGVELTYAYQLKVIKAMIASAKVSGRFNAAEKQRIFKAIAKMEISSEHKGVVFELLNMPISINEISRDIESIQHKSEIYLASCVVCNPLKTTERQHLDKLAQALILSEETIFEIELDAIQVIVNASY